MADCLKHDQEAINDGLKMLQRLHLNTNENSVHLHSRKRIRNNSGNYNDKKSRASSSSSLLSSSLPSEIWIVAFISVFLLILSCMIPVEAESATNQGVSKRESFEPMLRKREAEYIYSRQSMLAKREDYEEEESREDERKRRQRRRQRRGGGGGDDGGGEGGGGGREGGSGGREGGRGGREGGGGGGGGRRRRPRRRRSTTEAPGMAGAIYQAIAGSAEESTTAAPWFSGWGWGQETTTAQPKKVLKKRRRRIQTTTEEPETSIWNPYRYISKMAHSNSSRAGEVNKALTEAIDASREAFTDTLGYALIPGLQLLPFLAGVDAFTATLFLPHEDEPSESTPDGGSESRQTMQETIRSVISPVYPVFNWAQNMIAAGQKGKEERKYDTTTPYPIDTSTRSYTLDLTSFRGIMEAYVRYATYAMQDISNLLTRFFEKPIGALREGIRSGLWKTSITLLTTFQPQYALLRGVTNGVITYITTLFDENKILSNVPAIMKLHPFYWLEQLTRMIIDPFSLAGVNSDGVDVHEVYDGDSSTPRTISVARKYDPSIVMKLTPNYWFYYLWTNGIKSLNPFWDGRIADWDNEMTEDDGGGTNVLIKMNPLYNFYTFIKSIIKTAFGWGGKNPADDNFKIDSWFSLNLALLNPYKWFYAIFQSWKSFAKLLADPFGISVYWSINENPRNPDDRYRFVIKVSPGYWMNQLYHRLTDPFGNTIGDPLRERGSDKDQTDIVHFDTYTLKIRPYYYVRILIWPVFRFIFDPARLYTTEYIPENFDFILAPILETLGILRSKAKTTTMASVDLDDEYYYYD